MRHATILVAILAFVPLTSATAQDSLPVRAGDRVRVTGPEPCPPNTLCVGPRPVRRRTGVFVAYERDTLMLSGGPRSDQLAVPLTSITKLEVHRGQQPRGHTALRAVGGLVSVAALGAAMVGGIGLIVHATFNPFDKDLSELELEKDMLRFAVIGGALGMIGGILGARMLVDRWEEVPLDRLRVNLGPQRDGRFGLGASVRF